MPRVRREFVRGSGNGRGDGLWIVRGGTRGTKPVVVMGKGRANEVMGARRRVMERRAERARRSR